MKTVKKIRTFHNKASTLFTIVYGELINAKFYQGLNTKTWLLPHFVLEKFSIKLQKPHLGIYNISETIRTIRVIYTEIFYKTYHKELLILNTPEINMSILLNVAFVFNNWHAGFLTNFRLLVRRLSLAKIYYKFFSKLSAKQKDFIKIMLPQAIKKLPILGVTLGKNNTDFIFESKSLGLKTYVSPDNTYDANIFKSKILLISAILAQNFFALGFREIVQRIRFYDRCFFFAHTLKNLQKK
jgi:hypothetical protein